MRNMYEGIFTKTFTLFYGETLRFYFRIEKRWKIEENNGEGNHYEQNRGDTGEQIPVSEPNSFRKAFGQRKGGCIRSEKIPAAGTVCEGNVYHREGKRMMNEIRDLMIGIDFGKRIFTDMLL